MILVLTFFWFPAQQLNVQIPPTLAKENTMSTTGIQALPSCSEFPMSFSPISPPLVPFTLAAELARSHSPIRSNMASSTGAHPQGQLSSQKNSSYRLGGMESKTPTRFSQPISKTPVLSAERKQMQIGIPIPRSKVSGSEVGERKMLGSMERKQSGSMKKSTNGRALGNLNDREMQLSSSYEEGTSSGARKGISIPSERKVPIVPGPYPNTHFRPQDIITASPKTPDLNKLRESGKLLPPGASGLRRSLKSNPNLLRRSMQSGTRHQSSISTHPSQNSLMSQHSEQAISLVGTPGLSTADALLRRRKIINPFRREDEAQILQQQTHNRRRWSHVFPPGEVEFKLTPGPNWKSLCQPAILPLTTDYLPSPEQLRKDYTEALYALTLPDMDDPTIINKTYKSHKELLQEMVCQRFMQDFQLVEKPQVLLQKTLGKKINPDKTILYILSMGHRIHALSYDETTRQVDVMRYRLRYGDNASPNNRWNYTYLLWLPQRECFQQVSQTFFKYPNPEYNWNYVDELICGFNEELRPENKYRRHLYAVCPDNFSSDEDIQNYMQNKLLKLTEFLNSKRGKGVDPFEVEVINRQFSDQQTYVKSITTGSRGMVKTVSMRIPIQSNDTGRYEWLIIVCDKEVDPFRVYHIEVYWIVCTARNVRDFIQSISRKATQLGLTLTRIPEYSRSSNLNVHPLVTHPFIKMSSPATIQEAEEALLTRFDFVLDDERVTDWKELGFAQDGQAKESRSALTTSINQGDRPARASRTKSFDRQYFHRSGLAFVRVASHGFAWVVNRVKLKEAPPEVHAEADQLLQTFQSFCAGIDESHERPMDIEHGNRDISPRPGSGVKERSFPQASPSKSSPLQSGDGSYYSSRPSSVTSVPYSPTPSNHMVGSFSNDKGGDELMQTEGVPEALLAFQRMNSEDGASTGPIMFPLSPAYGATIGPQLPPLSLNQTSSSSLRPPSNEDYILDDDIGYNI